MVPGASVVLGQPVDYQQVNIMLRWNHQFQFAGYYAAIKKGFYKTEGLDVVLIENNSTQSAIERVLSGEADYGIASSDLILARNLGKPVVVLASIFQHSAIAIISDYDKNLKYLSDYVGKTLVTTEHDKAEISLLFAKEGISPDKINFIPHEFNIDPLLTNRADGQIDYISMQPIQLRMAGVEPRIIRPVDYGVDFYGDALFTTQKEIALKTHRVEQITRATIKGWEYALRNKDEIIDYILTLPGVQRRGITREMLKFEADMIEELVQPRLVEIGHINPQRWDRMASLFAAQSMLSRSWDSEGFIYNPDNPQHRQDLMLKIVIIILFSLGAMFLIVMLLNKQLKGVVNKRTAELIQLSQRDEALLHAIPDMLMLFNRKKQIVDYHPQNNDSVFHTIPSKFLGKNVSDVLPQEVATETKKCVDSVFDDGKMVQYSYSLTKDHSTRYYEARFVPSGSNEVLALIRDISDRVAYEEELIASQDQLKAASDALKENLIEIEHAKAKADEANKLKSYFLANMSHEIRTPMNGIIGFIQILHDMDLTQEEQSSYIDLLHESGKRLLDTINDIIEMSKIEAGHVELNNVDVNAYNMVKFLYDFFEPSAHQKGLKFYLDVSDEDKKFTFNSDQYKIESVLSNLIKNAIKFTDSGVVMFGFSRDENEVVFSVKDTGIGISDDRANMVFERFVQADLDLSRKHEGSGLGLSISKAYIEILGGRIWFESKENEGSRFYFSIPLK